MDSVHVRMLGGFLIRWEDREVTVSARSRKLYLLLAFLIWKREDPVSYCELSDLLWNQPRPDAASLNALKAILHRARSLLDQLWEGAGRSLLLSREGGCQWDPEFPLILDTDEFIRLCRDRQREALALYQGDFLPALAGQPWADGQRERLHARYLQTVLSVLPQLSGQEALELAGAAFSLDIGQEELCRRYMEALLALDRRQEAARAYEDFQECLLSRLGVLPSDQLRELYRQAQRDSDPRAISPATLLERLMEQPKSGALLCEYDFFQAICHSMSRMTERTGNGLHAALLSLSGGEGGPLAQHSLDRAMDHLQEVIRAQLRRGDVFTRCSASQFALLLPQTGYEDSRMICSRITRAFVRQYPHSPALIQVSVQPVPPSQ